MPTCDLPDGDASDRAVASAGASIVRYSVKEKRATPDDDNDDDDDATCPTTARNWPMTSCGRSDVVDARDD